MRPCARCGRLSGCLLPRLIRFGHGGRPLVPDLVAWARHGVGEVLDPWERHMAVALLDVDFNAMRDGL